MKTEQIVEELKQAAQRLGFQVRVEKGNFRGGRCTIDDESFIMLNKRHLPEVHLAVLADVLRDLPTETIFLRPAVREALEEEWRRQASTEAELDTEEADAE